MQRIGVLGLIVVGLLAGRAAGAGRTCDDLYFGYTGAPDRAAAYRCFDDARSERVDDPLGRYAPMVLMRLGGDGVAVDLDEATALLDEWKAAAPAPSRLRLHLRRVVLERRAGLGEGEREMLDLCSLPADAALEARCDEIRRRRDEARHARHVHGRAERLPDAARAELPRVTVAFGGYADREAERVERGGVLDDDVEDAVAHHRTRVQTQFDRVLRAVVVERTLAEASPLEASRVERDAARAFEADRRERAAAFEVYEEALPDSAATYERHRRRYDEAARQAEASWKRYRDAWVAVARAAAGNEADAAKADAAVRSLLARQRAALFDAASGGSDRSMR